MNIVKKEAANNSTQVTVTVVPLIVLNRRMKENHKFTATEDLHLFDANVFDEEDVPETAEDKIRVLNGRQMMRTVP